MKAFIRMCRNWLTHQRELTQKRRDEEQKAREKSEAFFLAGRPQPDDRIPAWVSTPDDPGRKHPRITHVHDVALPKMA